MNDQSFADDETRKPRGAAFLDLILAAERLFAVHGLNQVSLRQVVQAAGQKNTSAAHYHFGSREGLLRAVLTHRLPYIDQQRAELMARPCRARGGPDLRYYMEVFVTPLAEQLTPRPEGNHYLRFLSQHRRIPVDFDLIMKLSPAGLEMNDRLRALLAYLPAQIVEGRMRNAWSMIVHTLADIETEVSAGQMDAAAVEVAVLNIIDTMTASMSAPPSAEILFLTRPGPPQ